MSLILQNVIAFYRTRTLRVHYCGRKRTVASYFLGHFMKKQIHVNIMFAANLCHICQKALSNYIWLHGDRCFAAACPKTRKLCYSKDDRAMRAI